MTIYAIARIFSIVALASPFVLILLGAVCTLIPGGAKFINDLFLSALGEVPIFELAANMVQVFLENKNLDVDSYLSGFLAVLVNGVADALVMSMCIFGVKCSRVFFKNNGNVWFLVSEWRLTLVGVLIGVVLIKMKSVLAPLGQSLLFLIVTVSLLLYGMRLMFGGPPGRTYRNRRAGFLIPMLADIIGDMFTAMSAVFLVSCIMTGPYCVTRGGSFWTWLVCCGLSVLFLLGTSWLSGVLSAVRKA